MTAPIVRKAPAKLNLTLEVVQRLPNGYHTLRSLFVRVDKLADTVTTRVDGPRGDIVITTDSDDIPLDDTNICHRAAARYLQAVRSNAGVQIHIEKVIPVAAGLGGGSSDAAAVLLALNQHFDERLDTATLADLGADIGKDLPFFLSRAGSAYVSGLGEIVEPLGEVPVLRFLIVNPRIALSTAQAYQSLAQHVWFMHNDTRADISRAMSRAIASGSISAIAAMLYNDFEVLVERQHPVVKEMKQALAAFGAVGALMSGSGPTVFGLFDSEAALANARTALAQHYTGFFVAAA